MNEWGARRERRRTLSCIVYRLAGDQLDLKSTSLMQIPRPSDSGIYFLAAAFNFLRSRTQPSLLTCVDRSMASDSGGTSWVIVEPAAV